MTGYELIYWFEEYWYDIRHWQDADIVWLLARTAIICGSEIEQTTLLTPKKSTVSLTLRAGELAE